MEHLKLILLISSFIFPFALGITLFGESKNNISRKIMAVTLLTTSFLFLCNYLYFLQDYAVYVPIHGLHAGLEFMIFPGIYLYIKSIVLPEKKLKNEWWHFLFGVVMTVVACYIFYIYVGADDLTYFLKHNRLGFKFVGYQYHVLTVSRYVHLALVVLQGILYSIAFVSIPKNYNERLKNEFSNIENFSIDWINRYNLSFAGTVTIGFFLYAIVPLKGFHEMFIVGTFFLFSIYVCVMGIVSMRQQKVEIDLDELDIDYAGVAAKEDFKDEHLFSKLIDYIEKKQAFLQPDISLSHLCCELGTNRTYLSSLINQHLGMNFNSFINTYRVNYINEYLKQHPKTSKEELAQLGGFGSVSSLKRALSK